MLVTLKVVLNTSVMKLKVLLCLMTMAQAQNVSYFISCSYYAKQKVKGLVRNPLCSNVLLSGMHEQNYQFHFCSVLRHVKCRFGKLLYMYMLVTLNNIGDKAKQEKDRKHNVLLENQVERLFC